MEGFTRERRRASFKVGLTDEGKEWKGKPIGKGGILRRSLFLEVCTGGNLHQLPERFDLGGFLTESIISYGWDFPFPCLASHFTSLKVQNRFAKKFQIKTITIAQASARLWATTIGERKKPGKNRSARLVKTFSRTAKIGVLMKRPITLIKAN